MARETSREAFEEIKRNKMLDGLRMSVYAYVIENGPCTAREVTKAMLGQGLNSGSISTRFSELRRMGVIREAGTRLDEITKKNVILWEATNSLPEAIPKKKTNKEVISDLKHQNAILESEINELQSALDYSVEKLLETTQGKAEDLPSFVTKFYVLKENQESL